MTSDFRTKLYKYLSERIGESGTSPSFAEIIEAMGISPHSKSLITRSLRILEKEGKLKLTKQGRRLLIELVNKQLPLLGRISAGVPIEAITHRRFLDLESLLGGINRFALQVKGDSMIEEGIFDGDMIICVHSDTAKEGDIVVALIDQENTTLKRISYKINGMITLIPANSDLTPCIYTPERIAIQGIYLGLIRINS